MREIAATARMVLAATKPGAGTDGQPSKAKYVTDAKTVDAARTRVGDLLRSFPLYPQLGDDL